MGKSRVEDPAKHQRQKQAVANNRQPASVLSEKPSDCCPIPQNIPQSPEKTGNTRESTYVPFSGIPSHSIIILY